MGDKRTTRRDMRREATKVSVLEAAEAVFLRKGFAGTTIKIIADEAGVSPGTVLNAAPTKAALLVAVLHNEANRITESVEQLEQALTSSATDGVRALLQVILEGQLRHTELFAAALGHTWIEACEEFQAGFETLGAFWHPVRRAVEAGLQSGEFRSDLKADAVMPLLEDIMASAIREAAKQGGMNPQTTLSARLDVLMPGLKGLRAA